MTAMTADRREFARALDVATSVAERRSTVPLLQAVKVVANGALRLEATDLDIFATVEIGYQGKPVEPFALRGPHQLAKALRHLGDDVVQIGAPADKRVRITSGAFESALGIDEGEAEFPSMAPIGHEEFGADLGAGELAQIARVLPAISTEETRYYLNGICVDRIADWTYRFVVTDGHRLMIADVPLPGAVGMMPDRTIIPPRFVLAVMKHFAKTREAVRLTYGRRLLENKADASLAPEPGGLPLVRFNGVVGPARVSLTGKLIDGTYPDYTRVIPKEFAHTLRTSRGDLMNAMRGLMCLADGKLRALKLTAVEGGLRVSLHSVDLGDASFTVSAEHGFEPGTMIVGFNGQYLMDCLTSLRGDEVQFDLDAAHIGAPAAIHDPADTAFRCVLMPMRV